MQRAILLIDPNQVEYFISELNLLLAKKAEEHKEPCTQHLVFAKNIDEMMKYIGDHPGYKQIGFVLGNMSKPIHLSPIVYDRDANSFIQLDSVGFAYPLPGVFGAKFYFSPIPRQISDLGCREDAPSLLFAVLNNFSKFRHFYQNHCTIDQEIFQVSPVTELETQKETELLAKPNLLTQEDKAFLTAFTKKTIINNQLAVFDVLGVKPCTETYRLTEWPLFLIHFVERFDTVRSLLTREKLHEPETTAIVNRLLQTGIKRTTKTPDAKILEHLEGRKSGKETKGNDKVFDIAGRNFEERRKTWECLRTARYTKVFSFMSSRLHKEKSLAESLASSNSTKIKPDQLVRVAQKKLEPLKEKDIIMIADQVAGFVTGITQFRR